jgi:hypothetical protein
MAELDIVLQPMVRVIACPRPFSINCRNLYCPQGERNLTPLERILSGPYDVTALMEMDGTSS